MLVTSSAADSKIYNFSGGNSGAFHLLPRRKRKRWRHGAATAAADDSLRAIELLQEFEFNVSSQCIKVSPDGQYVTATGIYPPEMRVYDVQAMGLKFKRGLDYEVVDFLYLSEDYRKFCFLQVQRHLDIHSQGGTHHKLRIPREGRALCFLPSLASIAIASSSSDIYLLDLEDGCFLTPWQTVANANNCCFASSLLPLLAVGGDNGLVEFFDHRTARNVASLDVFSAASVFGGLENNIEVTCGAFSPEGLQMCVGCSNGVCLLYDLRSKKPLFSHAHMNFEPIKQLQWKSCEAYSAAAATAVSGNSRDSLLLADVGLQGSTSSSSSRLYVASCDSVSIHIWKEPQYSPFLYEHSSQSYSSDAGAPQCQQAEIVATIEAPVAADGEAAAAHLQQQQQTVGGVHEQSIARFNSFAFYPNSGLCFTTNEKKRMGIFFLPSLGLAPRWCSFLDTITEELEETAGGFTSSVVNGEGAAAVAKPLYDDFIFITRQQLEQLGVQELIGTAFVKRYMHGYFMDSSLYSKLKAALSPFDYEIYRRAKIQEKLEEKKKMRIEIRHKLPKANSELARRLQETASTTVPRNKKERKQQEAARQLLTDERFEKLFTNPDFEIEAFSTRT